MSPVPNRTLWVTPESKHSSGRKRVVHGPLVDRPAVSYDRLCFVTPVSLSRVKSFWVVCTPLSCEEPSVVPHHPFLRPETSSEGLELRVETTTECSTYQNRFDELERQCIKGLDVICI